MQFYNHVNLGGSQKMHIHPSLVASERYSRSAFGFDSQSFTSFRNNLVPRVSHLTAQGGGKM